MSTRILVLHAKQPTFFEASTREVPAADYIEVGQLDIDTRGDAALEAAYARTQNIDEAWRPQAPCRSTSVGDILVECVGSTHRAFEVAMCGFKPITLT